MHATAFAYLATPPSSAHTRSISLGPGATSPDPRPASLSKARSTNDLNAMAAANRATESQQDLSFRTINDPRTSSTSDLSRTGSISSKPGDASDEMTVLSGKLVSAIEHNSSLEESVADTRRELEASRARIARLEAEAQEHEQRTANYLTPEDVDELKRRATAQVEEERKQKVMVLQEKRGIEAELENLTTSLFEEANKMVAAANEQRAIVEKKNQQLRDQIKDGEAVIVSQTEQLGELKVLMQQINTDHRKDFDSPHLPLSPSRPGVGRGDSDLARLLEAMNLSPVTPEHGNILPSPATALTHLIRPSCRTDIPAYEDFKSLLAHSYTRSHNPSHAPSRAGSGSYGGIAAGLGLLQNNSNPNVANAMKGSEPATSKLAQAPQMPGQFSPNPDIKGPVPLKDTRFFKRIVAEDIEPTLRLDLSPTISWLSRRSILSALTDSTLIVEPIPEASQRLYGKYTSCAMCGDARKAGENPRTHAMRVREGEGATKWSICCLCLEKVRGVCDLVAYIRMIREGIVKCGDKKEEEEAWEELVRMRERLFWGRMAGGVVPAFLPSNKNSPVVRIETNGTPANADDEPTSTDGFHTPGQSRKNSAENIEPEVDAQDVEEEEEEETKSDRDVREQLERGLADATTFENMHSKAKTPVVSPPGTPSRLGKRESGGGSRFPQISIPKMPEGFWQGQVNTLR